MLDPPQEMVGFVEVERLGTRQQVQLSERRQRFERAGLLKERVPRAMQHLKRLDDKLDFPNSASTEFDVPIQMLASDDVALDAPLDRGNLVEQLGTRAPRIDERLMLAQKIVSQLCASRDPPRLGERESLPRFAESGVVIFHAREGARYRSRAAFGSETQIHAKERAGRIAAGEGLEDFRAQPIEPFMIR